MRRIGTGGDIAVTREEWVRAGWALHGLRDPLDLADLGLVRIGTEYRRFQRYAEQGDEVLLCPRPVYTEAGDG